MSGQIVEGHRASLPASPGGLTCPSWGHPEPGSPPCRACHLQLQCTKALRQRLRLQVLEMERDSPFLDMAGDAVKAVEEATARALAAMEKAWADGRNPDPAKVAALVSKALLAHNILDPWMASETASRIMAAGWRMEGGVWTR